METYQERYTAFIDILGFSELIKQSEKSDDKFNLIDESLNFFHSQKEIEIILDEHSTNKENHFIRISTFSDSTLLTTHDTLIALDTLLFYISKICYYLLAEGILTRGGIAKGKLKHTKEVAFGPGLVQAYKLENEIATHPRVAIDNNVAEDMDHLKSMPQLNNPASNNKITDSKGICYLNYLNPLFITTNRANVKYAQSEEPVDQLRQIQKLNLRNIVEAGNLSKKERDKFTPKLIWLNNYLIKSIESSTPTPK